MSSTVSPDFLAAVEDASVQYCMDLADAMLDELIVGGLAYGDEQLSDAEFVPYYLDLRDRGVLDFLPTVDPKLAEQYRRQFERAMGRAIEVA